MTKDKKITITKTELREVLKGLQELKKILKDGKEK